MVCVLKGASFFACELAKRITSPVYMDFMYVSSYGNGTESSGQVKITKDLEAPVEGENVLIAEDIIDSGNTLHFLARELKERGAKSVRICTLLSKPDRRVVEVPVDYVGYVIPDKFVVGYMDWIMRRNTAICLISVRLSSVRNKNKTGNRQEGGSSN